MKKLLLSFALFIICNFAISQNHAEMENNFNIDQISNLSGGMRWGLDKVWGLSNGSFLVTCNSYSGVNHFNNNPVKRIVKLSSTGNLDATFNLNYTGAMQFNDIAEQPDGKIIVVGGSGTGTTNTFLKRYNADGTLDSSFNIGTGCNGAIYNVKIQADGKIVLQGTFTYYQGIVSNRFVRLNQDGSKDTTFNSGLGSSSFTNGFEFQSDGKIVALGNSIYRLNADGSFDTTFSPAVASNNYIRRFHVLSDDSIIYIGSESIVKLSSNGSNDASFNPIISSSTVIKSFIQADGKVAIIDGTSDYYLKRFNADGTIFSSTVIGGGSDFYMQANNKLVVVGIFYVYQNTPVVSITRLNENGQIDPTFARAVGFDYSVWKVKTQLDHKILVAGQFLSYNNILSKRLIRLNEDGTVDSSFNIGTGFDGDIFAIDIQSDGKIIVGGAFLNANGVPMNHLARLNPDGSLDTSFQFVLQSNSYVNCVVIQPDGKIIVASNTYTQRLNSDGLNDATFSSISGVARVVKLQNDGKLVIGFGFNYYANEATTSYYGAVRRYNSNGNYDSSFSSLSFNTSANIRDIAIQNDGKILVGGTFSTYGSTAKKGLLRLNSNGTNDSTFIFGTGLTGSNVSAILYNPNGEIIISCNYTSATSTTPITLLSLNPDGTINPNFNSGKAFAYTASATCIEAQYDGKILLGGAFTNYNDYVAGCLVRLIGGGYYNLSGQNKLDADNNGCDVTDIPFPNLKFNFNDGASSYDFFSNTSGSYSFLLNAGNYTITPIVPNANFNVSPTSITANFPSQYTSLIQNYCLTSTSNTFEDLEVKIIPLITAIPGFNSRYKIVFKNKGINAVSGNVTFNYNDDVLDFVSSIPTFTSQSTNSMDWSFANLAPQEQRSIIVTMNLNSPTEVPPLNMGDVLHYTASITNFPTEIFPNDNLFVLNQTVFNSYDPNDKTCLEGTTVGIEKVGDYVHYLIRFENNGTANAQFIKVIDVIDTTKFDVSTLEPVNSSHSMVTKISETNKVEFFFDNIDLPFDDANNDGYVMYKIKLKSNLVEGDSFSNGASIYFDFNLPIITNTATTTISTLNKESFDIINSFSVYPNPVNDVLNIKKRTDFNIKSISIYNLLGQQMNFNLKTDQSSLDISNLKTGNYILKLETDKGTVTNKFTKL